MIQRGCWAPSEFAVACRCAVPWLAEKQALGRRIARSAARRPMANAQVCARVRAFEKLPPPRKRLADARRRAAQPVRAVTRPRRRALENSPAPAAPTRCLIYPSPSPTAPLPHPPLQQPPALDRHPSSSKEKELRYTPSLPAPPLPRLTLQPTAVVPIHRRYYTCYITLAICSIASFFISLTITAFHFAWPPDSRFATTVVYPPVCPRLTLPTFL